MTRRTGYFVAALAMFAPALAAQAPSATQAGQVVVPDNPAGRALKSWLDAFNSGDAARLNAYYQRYEPAKSADDVMGFRDATGGFELLSVEKSQPLHVEFLVKEKKGDTRAFGAFDVSPGESGAVRLPVHCVGRRQVITCSPARPRGTRRSSTSADASSAQPASQ